MDLDATDIDDYEARVLFWEAVTDWNADESLDQELSEEEKYEVEVSGYPERYFIHYLVNNCPDRDGLVRVLRQACATDGELSVYRQLSAMAGREGSGPGILKDLREVLKLRDIDVQMKFKKWQDVVDAAFPVA